MLTGKDMPLAVTSGNWPSSVCNMRSAVRFEQLKRSVTSSSVMPACHAAVSVACASNCSAFQNDIGSGLIFTYTDFRAPGSPGLQSIAAWRKQKNLTFRQLYRLRFCEFCNSIKSYDLLSNNKAKAFSSRPDGSGGLLPHCIGGGARKSR